MKVLLVVLLLIKYYNCSDFKTKFLINYLQNRNIMISFHTCTNSDQVKPFLLREGNFGNFLGLQIYKNEIIKPPKLLYLSHRIWYVIDVQSCKGFLKTLDYMNKTKMYEYPRKSLFLIDALEYESFFKSICKYDVLAGSEVYIATLNLSNVNVFEVYKIGKSTECKSKLYGNWSEQNGMTYYYLNESITQRRRNFQRYEVVYGAVVFSKESLSVNADDVMETKFEPYFFDDLVPVHNMIQFLNATYRIRLNKDFGHLNHTTGKFYGIINDLHQGYSDVAGSFFVSHDRLSVGEYIMMDTAWGTRFILMKPSMSYVENIYLMTFTKNVWLAALLVSLILGVAIYISLKWEVYQKALPGRIKKYTISDATLMSFEALCQQGTIIVSNTYSGRMLLFILFTAFMFLYCAYSGYILVLLQSTKPIMSIQHLMDSRLECGGLNMNVLTPWYHLNKDPILQALYTKKLKKNEFLTLEGGLAKVQEGNFAFHTVLSTSYNHIRRTFTNYEICKLQELRAYMNTGQYFVASKTSPHKQFFKIGLLRVYEVGLSLRNKHRISRKPKCYNEGTNFQSIGIYDCYTIMYLFIIGSSLSVLVLIYEIGTLKYQKLQK